MCEIHDGWRRETCEGVTLVRCDALSAVPGVAHAFSTRRAFEGSDFDLGGALCDDDRLARRRRALLDAAGVGAEDALTVRQVHGARVLRRAVLAGRSEPEPADGIVASLEDGAAGAPSVRVADCVPLLLADRAGRAIAAVHAGWRGTAAGVAGQAVHVLEELGVEAGSLIAALGPAIGGCCYEVGDDVVDAVARSAGAAVDRVSRRQGTGRTLDLREANRLQLVRAGLPGPAIHVVESCTRCEADSFFSYRRDGGRAGRMMACIGFARAAPGGRP